MVESLLLIEDEEFLGRELVRHYERQGWHVAWAKDLVHARDSLAGDTEIPLVVIADMSLPDGNALDLLEEARQRSVTGEWIFLTGFGTIPDSVRALRLGAYDYLEKPCSTERLDLVLASAARSAVAQRRLREQTSQFNSRYSPEAFVGRSPAAAGVREMLVKLSTAPLRACVLDGETGVGKGLAARILHYSGARASGPLVEVNCAALPRDLLESELFGHEAGAFTGAKTRHHGLIERANTGTLFLDEIGDLDPALQGKLLRAIEDGRVRRIGGEREFDVDVRFLAASNHDLDALVRSGAFREDLYHRLNVFGLQIPPLRQRLEDLPDLVSLFIEEYNVIASKRVRHVSDEVWRKLRRYSWPGNIRELRNVVERCVLLSEGDDFPEQWLLLPSEAPNAAATNGSSDVRLPLDGSMALDEMESHVIRTALERTGHNVMAAARLLGTTRQTLRYRIEKYGITSPKHLP